MLSRVHRALTQWWSQVFKKVVAHIDRDRSGEVDYREFMRYFGQALSHP